MGCNNKAIKNMAKFKIEIECDEWWVADSLFAISTMVENDDILDNMENGKVEVSDTHFTATIKESE